MSGTIVVKAKDASVPDQAQIDKDATAQRDELVNKIVPAYNDAKAGKFPLPGVKNVAGYGSQNAQGVLVDEMITATISAKVGEKVSWTVIGRTPSPSARHRSSPGSSPPRRPTAPAPQTPRRSARAGSRRRLPRRAGHRRAESR